MAILRRNLNDLMPKPGDPNFVGPVRPSQVTPPPLPGQSNFIGPVRQLPYSPAATTKPTALGGQGGISTQQMTNPPFPTKNAPTTPTEDPMAIFLQKLTEMLTNARQGLSNEDLFNAQSDVKRTQAEAVLQETPESLKGYSPDVQNAYRSMLVKPLESNQDYIAARIKANDSRLQNFESMLKTAKEFGEGIAKLSPSPEVMTGYTRMIEEGVSPMDSNIPDEIRNKLMASLTPESIAKYRASIDRIETAKKSSSSSRGLTPYQEFQATQSLKKTLTSNTSAAQELQRQSNIMTDTWNRFVNGGAKDLNGTSQAIIITFNKLLDPTSVVRETEYDRSSQGQALIQTIQGKVAALVQGGPGLTQRSLKELVDLGVLYARNANAKISQSNEQTKEEAKFFGLNPDFIVQPTGINSPTDKVSLSDEEAYKIYLQSK